MNTTPAVAEPIQTVRDAGPRAARPGRPGVQQADTRQASPAAILRASLSSAWPGTLALAVAMGIGRFAFTPVWPVMAQQYGLSLSQGSWLAAANYAGYLVAALVAMVYPVRSPATALRLGLAAVTVLTLAMAAPAGYGGWIVFRLLAGAASAYAFIAAVMYRRPETPTDRAIAVPDQVHVRTYTQALTYAGVGLGVVVSGLACIATLYAGADAPRSWLVLGVLAAALTAVAWPVLRSETPAQRTVATAVPSTDTGDLAARAALRSDTANLAAQPTPRSDAGDLAARPTSRSDTAALSARAAPRSDTGDLAARGGAGATAAARGAGPGRGARTGLLALLYGVFGAGYIIPATFLPAMAREVIHQPAIFGLAWPIFGLAAMLSCLLAPAILAGSDERRLWRVAQLAMAAGIGAAALWDDAAAVGAAALLVGGTFVLITQAGMMAARRSAQDARGQTRAAAAMTAAFATGQFAGPLATAAAAGLGIPFGQMLGAAALVLMLAALALPRR
jgi:hypothetical protein